MGSPVVAILALVLGYTLVRAGIKNESIVASFQGQDVSNPVTLTGTQTATPSATTSSPLITNSGSVNVGKVKAQ